MSLGTFASIFASILVGTCLTYPVTAQAEEASMIAFVSDRTGSFQIYVIDLRSSAVSQLTQDLQAAVGPSWLPDGSHIMFLGSTPEAPNTYRLYLIKPDGSERRLLLETLPDQYENVSVARPSPDGKQAALILGKGRGDSYRSALAVLNMDTGSATVYYAENADDPRWSPDGSQIVFASYALPQVPTLYVVNADGSALDKLRDDPVGLVNADWSPDGSQFVYVHSRSIRLMSRDGKNSRVLTETPRAFDRSPRWSPNGKQIAFISNRSNPANELWVMSADGTDPKGLLGKGKMSDVQSFEWLADGRLLFSAKLSGPKHGLYIAKADGTGLVTVTDGAANDLSPASRPQAPK
jgi:Tol biopolymer transport system component